MTPDPAVLHQIRKLAAIEAISQGRFADAEAILAVLMVDAPVQRGVCRYCGCSEARACGILNVAYEVMPSESEVARCGWADRDCTVCTNVSCLERWRREVPAELDVNIHDAVEAVGGHVEDRAAMTDPRVYELARVFVEQTVQSSGRTLTVGEQADLIRRAAATTQHVIEGACEAIRRELEVPA